MELSIDDWQEHGHDLPLLVNVQPAGKHLCESFHRAGGGPAVMAELLEGGLLDGSPLTVSGKSVSDNLVGKRSEEVDVIKTVSEPLRPTAGFQRWLRASDFAVVAAREASIALSVACVVAATASG